MNARLFAISFLSTGLLLSPLVLDARAPTEKPPRVAPRSGARTTVRGMDVHAQVLDLKGTALRVRLTGRNAQARPVDLRLAVVVSKEPPMAQLSRVMLLPTRVTSREVAVQLAPGQALDRIVTLRHAGFRGASLGADLRAVPGLGAKATLRVGLQVAGAGAARTAAARGR